MSSLFVEVCQIDAVEKHPNADRLDLVKVKGWACVAGRTNPAEPKYKVGDKVIFIPIDSILPPKLEELLFPADSKIHLSKSRIKTIKLRGAVSQGMVIDIDEELNNLYPKITNKLAIGTDVADILGITKYQPPQHEAAFSKGLRQTPIAANNPNFRKYTDIENYRFYPDVFKEGEMVYVTEKLHGTSARYANLEVVPNCWWQKLLKFFHLLPKNQFCYGSRNMQLQGRIQKKVYYSEDVYGKIARKLNLAQVLAPGESLYGEIVGYNIQKGYPYGCLPGEHKFFAYDVKVNDRWLDSDEFKAWCDSRQIPRVPELFKGPFYYDLINKFVSGDSYIAEQKTREGVVVKPVKEDVAICGRKILKMINLDYLIGDQTEFQ